ncbi:MAG: flavoprotein [Isosphaeraceae bacterium]
MTRLILGITGSVAAIKTPELLAALRAAGHTVRVVATRSSLYFFDPAEIDRSSLGPEGAPPDRWLYRDEDEWPGTRYRRGDEVLHIALRNWAELLIIAPLDANTLSKLALGISDNCLSCVFRAWDFSKPILLAPAMNTLMWQSPVTRRHLGVLLADRATGPIPDEWTLDEAPLIFARYAPQIVLIPPQAKRLACGDVGLGAMAGVPEIAEVVRRWSEKVAPDDLA